MISEEKIEELRALIFSKTNVSVRKDDPILISGAVIEAMLESYLRQGQEITDQVFGEKFVAVDGVFERHVSEVKRLNQSHAENIEKFLKLFRATIDELNQGETNEARLLAEEIQAHGNKIVMHTWLAALATLGVLLVYVVFVH